jgi:hypothetical protein
VLGIKTRAAVLGLLALLLVGSISAGSASANPGPICWHRANSKDVGARIPATAPEPFGGVGGTQVLTGAVPGQTFEITSTISQGKGVIYNSRNQAGTAIQCQIKAWFHYQNPTLTKPVISGCTLTLGTAADNNIQVYGEFLWKYAGVAKELTEQPQLVQKPDLVMWPASAGEVTPGGGTIPSGEFTKINYGVKCGVFSSTKVTVKGTVGVAIANHLGEEGVEKWDTNSKQEILPEAWQHFWVGTETSGEYKEFKPGLFTGNESASYKGPTQGEVLKRQQQPIQEIALKEGP